MFHWKIDFLVAVPKEHAGGEPVSERLLGPRGEMKQWAIVFKHTGKMTGENWPYQAVFFSFGIQAKADQLFFYDLQWKMNSSGYQGVVESIQEFLAY